MSSFSIRAARTIKPFIEHGMGGWLLCLAGITLAFVWFTPVIGAITDTLAAANLIALHLFLPAGYNLALVALITSVVEKLQQYDFYEEDAVLGITWAIYGMVSAFICIFILSRFPQALGMYMLWICGTKLLLAVLTVVAHEVSKV